MAATKTTYVAKIENNDRPLIVESKDNGTYAVTVDRKTLEIDVREVSGREYHLIHEGQGYSLLVDGSTPELTVYHDGNAIPVRLLDERQSARLAASGVGGARAANGTIAITAPMPGQVVKCLVKEGEAVTAGQGVIVVEAMKMENELKSAVDGMVKAFKVAEGDNVEAGECLVVIE